MPLLHPDELGYLELPAGFRTVLVLEQVRYAVEHHRPGALENSEVHARSVPVVILEDATSQALAGALTLDLG
jgi:hypothetical protein